MSLTTQWSSDAIDQWPPREPRTFSAVPWKHLAPFSINFIFFCLLFCFFSALSVEQCSYTDSQYPIFPRERFQSMQQIFQNKSLMGRAPELWVIFSILSIIHCPIYPHKCLALFRSINNRLGSPSLLSPRGESSLRAVLMEFRSPNVLHNWSMIRKRSASNLIALSSISGIYKTLTNLRW